MSYKKEFIRCSTCDKSFSGPEPYQDHLNSQKHKKNVGISGPVNVPHQSENGLRCEVCDIALSGPIPYAQHMESRKHKQQLNKNQIVEELKLPSNNNTPAEDKVPSLYPNLVEVTPNPNLLSEMHVNVLKCELCDVCFSGPENLKEHLESKKHQRKLDMEDWKQILGKNNPTPTAPSYDRNGDEAGDTDSDNMTPAVSAVPVLDSSKEQTSAPMVKNENLPNKKKKPTSCFGLFRCGSSKKKSNKVKKNEKVQIASVN